MNYYPYGYNTPQQKQYEASYCPQPNTYYNYNQSQINTRYLWDNYYRNAIGKKKSELWLLSNLIGLTVIGFLILQYVTATVSFMIFPNFYTDMLIYESISILVAVISIICPFLILGIYGKSKDKNFNPWPMQKVKFGHALALFFMGLSVTFLGNYVSSIFSMLFNLIGIEYNYSTAPVPEGAFALTLYIVSSVVIPAICEEFAVRGVLLSSLRRHGDKFAIVVSAIVFALMHFNMVQAPFAFIMGLIAAYITIYTNNIWISVAIHAVNNLGATLVTIFSQYYPSMSDLVDMSYYIFFFAVIVIGITLMVIYAAKKKGFLKIKKGDYVTRRSTSYYRFFCAPAIIVVFVIFILMSFVL